MSFVRVLNRNPLRRQRSLGFAGFKPGNFFNMQPIFEESWNQYPSAANLAGISPPWTVALDTANLITAGAGYFVSGNIGASGSYNFKRLPALFNPLKPWRLFGQMALDTKIIGTQYDIADANAITFIKFAITAGPSLKVTLSSFSAVNLSVLIIPYLAGDWINWEYNCDGQSLASFYSTHLPSGSFPDRQLYLANMNVGTPFATGGINPFGNGAFNGVEPNPLKVGPISLYGSPV